MTGSVRTLLLLWIWILWAAVNVAAQEKIARPLTADQAQELNASRGSEGNGARIFVDRCTSCHGNAAMPEAQTPADLKRLPPEQIYNSLTTGSMANIASDITDVDKRAIATWVAGRRLTESVNASASAMPNVCAENPPIADLNSAPSWNGWGIDISNTRFQPRKSAGMSAGEVSRLRLKWAFSLPGATAVYGQTTVVDGRVFVSSDTGNIYSLDAETGCVLWSFQAAASVRTAITFGPRKSGPDRFAAYFGDVRGNVYALDPNSGELLWKISVDPHPLSRVIGTPMLYEDRLYVPVASLEEVESGSAMYVCCTFRGMVAALEAETGKQVWKTYTIAETPKQIRTNALGKPVMGPSGAGIWDTPTIDPVRRAIYVATGNAFSEPATETSDAIMAMSLDSGEVLWSFQATAFDVWHGGCGRGLGLGRQVRKRESETPYPLENCPENGGPDQDFSGGIILKKLADGSSILIAGQKPGVVWGLDPDRKGAVVWREDVGRRSGNSGVIFGGAADDEQAYYALKSGDVVALRLTDGIEQWHTKVPPQESMASHRGITASVTLIPGVVFTAGLDGMVRAFATRNGNLLWEYNTAQEFRAVNGLTVRGGSIGQAGPSVVNGMVFVGSGYIGFQNGAAGNVLLAFEPTPTVPPYY